MENKEIIKILRNYFIGRGWNNLKDFKDGYFYEKRNFIEIYVFFCNYPNIYNNKTLGWYTSYGEEFNKLIKYFLEHVNIALTPHKKEIYNQTIFFNFRHNRHEKMIEFQPFSDNIEI